MQLPNLLIRLDLVRRGDVLLTHSDGVDAKKLVAYEKAGAGSSTRFSHAAFFARQSSIYESDGAIIGFKSIVRIGKGRIDGKPSILGHIPGSPIAAAVFRHPQILSRSRFDLNSALRKEIEESYGRDYSRLFRLWDLSIFQHGRAGQGIKSAARHAERILRPRNVPGPFCSELVARLFDKLQLPLFTPPIEARSVSPNMLANSLLREEGSIVVPGEAVDSFVLQEGRASVDVTEDEYTDRIAPIRRENRVRARSRARR